MKVLPDAIKIRFTFARHQHPARMFSDQDFEQLRQRGITLQTIENQIHHFQSGFPFMKLVRPAIPGDGIRCFDESQLATYLNNFEKECRRQSMLKFVPASGAASRMFKHLYEYLQDPVLGDEHLQKDQHFQSLSYFLSNLRHFAFYSELAARLTEKGRHPEEDMKSGNYLPFIEGLLETEGLNYGSLPKGLLKFHLYPDGSSRTAIEEHLMEGILYCRDASDQVQLHFTLSPEHVSRFQEHIRQSVPALEMTYGVHITVTHSIQKPSTDTLAVDMHNQAFREADGSLVFRPGGHGALIENLNDLDAGLIFIKNIDNVVPDHHKQATVIYKKVLAAYLQHVRQQVHDMIPELKDQAGAERTEQIRTMMETELNISTGNKWDSLSQSERNALLMRLLDRPIRVCGMVRNEGEPGGGPYWTMNRKGEVSLQIVESSQVDMEDPAQKAIFSQATHFNPVDIVCNIHDYMGNKYDLHRFVDEETGFISVKSKDGRMLKAQELPGLWNGAMADWITLFVEVPVATFNPVKTINDLLRDMHR